MYDEKRTRPKQKKRKNSRLSLRVFIPPPCPCPVARLPACSPVRLFACPPARLPACPPARLPACPPARLPARPPPLPSSSGQAGRRVAGWMRALPCLGSHVHGFDCRWRCLSASDLGAPHERNRWFLLARRRNGMGTARVILQSVAEIMQAARRFGWHAEKGHPARAKSRLITAAECSGHKARNHAIWNALAPFQARAAFVYLIAPRAPEPEG